MLHNTIKPSLTLNGYISLWIPGISFISLLSLLYYVSLLITLYKMDLNIRANQTVQVVDRSGVWVYAKVRYQAFYIKFYILHSCITNYSLRIHNLVFRKCVDRAKSRKVNKNSTEISKDYSDLDAEVFQKSEKLNILCLFGADILLLYN